MNHIVDGIFSKSCCSRPETTQGYNSLWPLHRSAISCHIPKTQRHFFSCFCPSGTDAQSSLHGGGCEDCTQQDHGGQSPSTGACTTFADHFDEWFGQRQSHLVPQARWFLPSLKIIEPLTEIYIDICTALLAVTVEEFDSFRETGIFKTQCIAACSEAGGVLCSAGRSRCGNCLCSCLTFDEHDSSAAVHKRGKLMSNATSAVRWWCCIHVLYKHFTVLHIYIIYTYTFYIIPRFYIFGLRLRMFCLPLVHKLRMPQTRRFIGYGLWIAVRSWEEKF